MEMPWGLAWGCLGVSSNSSNFLKGFQETQVFGFLKLFTLLRIGNSTGSFGFVATGVMDGMKSSEDDQPAHKTSALLTNEPDIIRDTSQKTEPVEEFGPNLRRLCVNNQIKELQTVIRDKNTTRSDFKFYSDRLIRLVVEEGLNQLPYSKVTVITPTGRPYEGLNYEKGNCGVSIVRSGEAMEQGLRDCCRSIRIGKILIQSDEDTHEAKIVYAKFPDDIKKRKVLLMYPIMSTGNTVIKAVRVLKEHGVPEESIILLNLFCTPIGAQSIIETFPGLTILTSEVHPVAPNHFGQKYFGTD